MRQGILSISFFRTTQEDPQSREALQVLHLQLGVYYEQCPDRSYVERRTPHLNLSKNMKIHTGKNSCKCKLCGKTYSSFSSLHAHLMIHSGEKPYKCEYCDVCCYTASALRRHRKTHTGEKPYKCDICPKAFLVLGNLKIHRVIHTGEKPYKCNHTSEKPFQCEQCEKAFTRSTHLIAHIKTHNSSSDNAGSQFIDTGCIDDSPNIYIYIYIIYYIFIYILYYIILYYIILYYIGTRQASSQDTKSLTRARFLLFPSTRDGTCISEDLFIPKCFTPM